MSPPHGTSGHEHLAASDKMRLLIVRWGKRHTKSHIVDIPCRKKRQRTDVEPRSFGGEERDADDRYLTGRSAKKNAGSKREVLVSVYEREVLVHDAVRFIQLGSTGLWGKRCSEQVRDKLQKEHGVRTWNREVLVQVYDTWQDSGANDTVAAWRTCYAATKPPRGVRGTKTTFACGEREATMRVRTVMITSIITSGWIRTTPTPSANLPSAATWVRRCRTAGPVRTPGRRTTCGSGAETGEVIGRGGLSVHHSVSC